MHLVRDGLDEALDVGGRPPGAHRVVRVGEVDDARPLALHAVKKAVEVLRLST